MKARARTVRPGRAPIVTVALLATAALGALATTAAGCGSGAGATPKITTTARAGVAPTPPAQGAYFGAWVPPGDAPREDAPSGSPSASPSGRQAGKEAGKPGMAPLAAFEGELGRRLDIAQSYRGWKSSFPSRFDESVLASDRYLLLTWAGADTEEIVRGSHDGLIRAKARAIKATGKPVFLRWARDMDKESQEKRVHSPAAFIAAWKHMRAIFKAEKVDNVAWVWCPTVSGFGSRNAPAYYPGDGEVDWICADAQPGGGYEYRDLSEAMKLFLEWARERPKPIMIAEFGVPKSYDRRRAEWLRAAARTLQDPQVKAVVYFNSDEQAEEPRDERRMYAVTGDEQAISALREFATTPYFNPRNLPVTSG